MNEISNFLSYKKLIENKSQNTIIAYKRDLQEFELWLLQEKFSEVVAYSEIKRTDLLEYMEYRANLGESASTRARKTSALKSFFQFMLNNDMISKDIASGLKSPKIPHKEPVFASASEAKAIINACRGKTGRKTGYTGLRDSAMFSILVNCGLRREELVSLDVSDINHEERCLLVHGKGAKERTAYLNNDTYKSLSEYLKAREGVCSGSCEALFVTRSGKRIDSKKINEIMSKALRDAGITDKHYTPHTLRKTCATLMSQSGEDIRTIQRVLGHSNIQTTTIYTGVEERQKAAAGRNFSL